MSTIEVKVPDIGDFTDIPIIEIFVKAGDTVKAEDSLVTLESDKATMDVPSPSAGTVKEVRVKLGDKVSEGTAIVVLDTDGAADAGAAIPAAAAAPPAAAPAPAAAPPAAAPAAAPPPAASAAPAAAKPPPVAAPVDGAAFKAAHASPSVRKFARELGVDLSRVKGSGPKGRVLQEDVQSFVKTAMSAGTPAGGGVSGGGSLSLLPWPTVDFAKFGPVEARPLSRIKKISGANLARNWVMIPHVTQFDEADITDLEAFRVTLNKENEKAGIKVTMLAFLIKASVAALKRFPDVNASLDGDNLILKQYFNIGFAADTPNGLVVPVIRNADQKGVLAIAAEMTALSAKAREGKLGPADMQGGCFLDLEPGRHRRHGIHADHQRAGSRDPRRVEEHHQARLGRQGVRAAADGAAVVLVRPSRDRRRVRRALHRAPRGPARRHAPGGAVSAAWRSQARCPRRADSRRA